MSLNACVGFPCPWFYFLTNFLKRKRKNLCQRHLFSPCWLFPRGHTTAVCILGEIKGRTLWDLLYYSQFYHHTCNSVLHFVQKGNNDRVSHKYSGGLAKSNSTPYNGKTEQGGGNLNIAVFPQPFGDETELEGVCNVLYLSILPPLEIRTADLINSPPPHTHTQFYCLFIISSCLSPNFIITICL